MKGDRNKKSFFFCVENYVSHKINFIRALKTVGITNIIKQVKISGLSCNISCGLTPRFPGTFKGYDLGLRRKSWIFFCRNGSQKFPGCCGFHKPNTSGFTMIKWQLKLLQYSLEGNCCPLQGSISKVQKIYIQNLLFPIFLNLDLFHCSFHFHISYLSKLCTEILALCRYLYTS